MVILYDSRETKCINVSGNIAQEYSVSVLLRHRTETKGLMFQETAQECGLGIL